MSNPLFGARGKINTPISKQDADHYEFLAMKSDFEAIGGVVHQNSETTNFVLGNELHNPFGPAIITKDRKEYLIHNQHHRVDGPAIEYANGNQEWYLAGELHRTNGPAVTQYDCQEWFLEGKRHREDGPAILYPEGEEWFLGGVWHRLDGPAVSVTVKGETELEWWILGARYINQKEFEKALENFSKQVEQETKTYEQLAEPAEPAKFKEWFDMLRENNPHI